MPDIRMPDGQVVRFPDSMPKDQIKSIIQSKMSKVPVAPMAPEVGVGEDVAKSGASGLARGVADLAGLPGTVGDALNAGGEWVMRKMGLPTRSEAMQARGLDPSDPMGGNAMRGYLSSATGGATDYQPQTTAGEYARTFGEFAPAAVAGPGGLLRKAAMTTVPAVASETAGQVTKGTEYEPWARVGGALAGGIASAGRGNVAAEASKGAVSREALKSRTDALYGALRQQGIKYDSNAWNQTIGSMGQALHKEGIRPSQAEDVFKYVDDLMKSANHSLDFDDINSLHQAVGQSARDAAAQQKGVVAKAWGIVQDKLDEFEASAPLMTNTGVPQDLLNRTRQVARRAALQNIKQRTIDKVVRDADTYASGQEAGIRNGIGNLLRSKKGEQLFKGEERKALLNVVHGRKGLRTLSRFGFDISKVSGNATLIPTIGATYMGAVDPIVAGGLVGAGTVAKQVSPMMTRRAVEQASAAIRSGKLTGAGGSEIANRLMRERLARVGFGGQMAGSSYQSSKGR